MKKKNNFNVFVAMSGGVDSSVAAALLKKQGYNVLGLFMKFWSEPSSKRKRENKCCSPEAERRARKVAKKLNIPFHVLDLSKDFKKWVVDDFVKNYSRGLTPNPCVKCNKYIKFGLLWNKIRALGADFLATGHYVRVKKRGNNFQLWKGKNKNKDQSYFLYNLKQKDLKHLLFPIGSYTKDEVKKLAEKFGLPTAKARESFDVCFVSTTVEDFLKKRVKPKKGLIIDTSGKRVGEHRGLAFYTIGQRTPVGGPGPYYVVRADFKNNILVVTNKKNDPALYAKELIARKVNWISDKAPKLPIRVKVQIRYNQKAAPATVKKYSGSRIPDIKVVFDKPQRAVTPGQSVVFYKGNEVVGGGVIV